MNNFVYHIPTKVYFGKGQIENLGPAAKEYGERVLVVSYAKCSDAEEKIYAEVIRQLKAHDLQVWEFREVEINPRVTSVNAGAQICREHDIQLVLAVGGGGAIDCAKVIAEAASYDGDAWDLVLDNGKVKSVIPVACVVTIAAAGSEMDTSAVVNNLDTNEKLMIFNDNARPRFSILDPTYTFTVPKRQTAFGGIDIISHLMEIYFRNTVSGCDLQYRMIEGIMIAVMKNVRIALENPEDYDARATLLWASGWAINGFLTSGNAGDWPVHNIEHEISAFYSNVTHAAGVSAITAAWMEYVLCEETVERFCDFAINVCKIAPKDDPMETAKAGIEYYKAFRKELGLPECLSDLGVTDEHFEAMAKGAVRYGPIQGFRKLEYEDVLQILKNAL